MAYYLGCECDAALTPAWSKASSGIHVSELRDCDSVVRERLPFPCVRWIRDHTGCGCGFRRDGEDSTKQANHDALVAYLRSLPPQSRPMQIYGCWSGDESKPAEHFRTCAIADLASPDFGFRERELITLVT
jgi:hypothetical protein